MEIGTEGTNYHLLDTVISEVFFNLNNSIILIFCTLLEAPKLSFSGEVDLIVCYVRLFHYIFCIQVCFPSHH